ncbi:DNA polymerase delta catalytic subunit [Cymbomonas tetramitiformis]|uniref:DNA polymerase n=1 Tax=Cymbomonas tetramitiformis TaxID=36881 RepID=A0AAE0F3S1_9CHLO|nr:DNA polymerase delta catalytic subunit [Cymbomonas tetramitiformis]KAK3289977.1 DNA polymerase delta catalytic subunit [Cymbomonas tetramitiformis]
MSTNQTWTRAIDVADAASNETPVTFMQTSVEDAEVQAHTRSVRVENSMVSGWVPAFRVFGVTRESLSVCAHVHGFLPYLWCATPEHAMLLASERQLTQFTKVLNSIVSEKAEKAVVRVESLARRSVMHHSRDASGVAHLKITLQRASHIAKCRRALLCVENFKSLGLTLPFDLYEADVDCTLRYMVDTGTVGCAWATAPAKAYVLRTAETRETRCAIELDVDHTKLIAHDASVPPYDGIAPLRVLSFDIECCAKEEHFPHPDVDPVIQIASVLAEVPERHEMRRVYTLGSCANIPGATVVACDTETALLRAWSVDVIAADPDMIVGYNVQNFDIDYLLKRAANLRVDDFALFGRVRRKRVESKEATFSSKAMGTRKNMRATVDGRIVLDVMQIVQTEHKLSSYTLNHVSERFLMERKEDVHHSMIAKLHRGDRTTRQRLAVYCLKDALLPVRLLRKLMIIFNLTEMARVTGVPLSYLLHRGQSIKVFSQLLRRANVAGMLLPTHERSAEGEGGDGGVAYEGATVLDAKAGFYEVPIATLDFASLYPSIMRAHNLCYTTLVPRGREHEYAPDELTVTPTGDRFVRSHVHRGLLPAILDDLLTARKRARALIKTTEDPTMRGVLEGRQLALKLSANSVYGFTGATVGKLPCLPISASTTAFGREMIDETRRFVLQEYTVANGYSHDADVVYGDTDSVMVRFGCADVTEAMRLGALAADRVTTLFPKPVQLEFEKVYHPYLLMGKKRYAGLMWTCADRHDKLDTKGIETVRRDNCALVRRTISEVLRRVLLKRDVQGSVRYVQERVRDLLAGRVDISELVITKGLTRDVSDYATRSAHVELAVKKRKRDAATAPRVGDRVPYVILRGHKADKTYELAEDPNDLRAARERMDTVEW